MTYEDDPMYVCNQCKKRQVNMLINMHSSTGHMWNKFVDFCSAKCFLKFIRKNPEYAWHASSATFDTYEVHEILSEIKGIKKQERNPAGTGEKT